MQIWFKTYKKSKLKHSQAFSFDENTSLFDMLSLCSNEFDLPCPVILPSHERYYREFGLVNFSKKDYVEDVIYDKIEIEIFE